MPASGTALLLIDVINDLAFEGSEALVEQAESMATRLAALKRRATAAGVPAIYINDNFGQWRSDFRQTVTANDAYMREFKIDVPPDCIVSNTTADNEQALQQIRTVMKGTLATSTELTFRRGVSRRKGKSS